MGFPQHSESRGDFVRFLDLDVQIGRDRADASSDAPCTWSKGSFELASIGIAISCSYAIPVVVQVP